MARPRIAAAALFAGLALVACGGSPQAPQQPAAAASPHPTASPSTPPALNASPVAANSVNIANFAFSPAVITVRVGTAVTWTDMDQDAHTVAITGAPVSQALQNADTFTHTFGQAGSFSYICTIHPLMKGMVIVTSG
jgi:plastocyanin